MSVSGIARVAASSKKLVAIHQPNYAPWLGYFYKMARADVFIFLDDAQFSRGSYTNRVQIAANGPPRWLTVPVRHAFGASINRIEVASERWAQAHLDTLHNSYAKAAHFRAVWPDILDIYAGLPSGSLADANISLILSLSKRLGIETVTQRASDMGCDSMIADDRLIALCHCSGENVCYLSGKGGSNYQDEQKFKAASIDLIYANFEHPRYPVGEITFVAGLSVFDAVFHLGWSGAAALLKA